MPHPTRAQLVLLELAGAAVALGLVGKGIWLIVGAVAAVLFAFLGAVRWQHRWLYQVALSRVALLFRRPRSQGPGLGPVVGGYDVVTVPRGTRNAAQATIGAIRSGTTWALPLEVRHDRLFNDDAAVPLAGLAELLTVEDVPLASVRFLTLVSPSVPQPNAPAGPGRPLARLAASYCVLTLDTLTAADAIASRGGTDQSVHQILRRCARRAEEILGSSGVMAGPMDEPAIAAMFATCLGPTAARPDGSLPDTVETWQDVQVAGLSSVTVAVTGPGALDRVSEMTAVLPVPVVATAIVVQPGSRGGFEVTLLVRASGPGAPSATFTVLADAARRVGLDVQRLDGEQAFLLRATTPLGLVA